MNEFLSILIVTALGLSLAVMIGGSTFDFDARQKRRAIARQMEQRCTDRSQSPVNC